jgi:hypothetical protein
VGIESFLEKTEKKAREKQAEILISKLREEIDRLERIKRGLSSQEQSIANKWIEEAKRHINALKKPTSDNIDRGKQHYQKRPKRLR